MITFVDRKTGKAYARVPGMSVAGLNLRGVDLSWRCLKGIDFSYCDLTDADLTGADLRGCRFFKADLTRTKLAHRIADDTTTSSTFIPVPRPRIRVVRQSSKPLPPAVASLVRHLTA